MVASAVSPSRAFVTFCILVALSTAAFPFVAGYGTFLFQAVALGGWWLVAAVTSDRWADLHHLPVLVAAATLNVVVFGVPAAVILFTGRLHWPAATVALLTLWLIFYALSLFLLFPATDGP